MRNLIPHIRNFPAIQLNCQYDSSIHVTLIVVEGYVAVSDIVKTLSKQRHNRYLREEDVIRVVKNCPPTCQPDWLILDENSPIRVKATWGHVMPVRHITL